jgi:hypothetical protein
MAAMTQARIRSLGYVPLISLFVAGMSTPALAQQASSAAQSQWFTGPLVAPSPALSKAGTIEIEPYAVHTGNTGAFDDNWTHHSGPHDFRSIQSETLLEYGITDRLSIQAVPSFGYLWTDQTTSRGVGLGDLPVELKYRVTDQNVATGAPSVTLTLGMSFPIADYDRLRNAAVGPGSGVFTAKEGVLAQSLFDTWGNHALRLRFYGDLYEPVATTSVHDISVYGTDRGFGGRATVGVSEDSGIGVEYGLTQRWVLALDLVQNYGGVTKVNGTSASGSAVSIRNASSIAFSLAPAIEYNISGNVGVIAGVQFPVAGRNTSSYTAPQIAISVTF